MARTGAIGLKVRKKMNDLGGTGDNSEEDKDLLYWKTATAS